MCDLFRARQAWMRVLSLSSWRDLQQRMAEYDKIPCALIRQPEVGLVMLRGRMGGTGAPFNFGEASVTRCAVRTDNGIEGHAYVLGRNLQHARAAALCDALLQDERLNPELQADVIAPLSELLASRRELAAQKAAATKVDFFTLVRGEND